MWHQYGANFGKANSRDYFEMLDLFILGDSNIANLQYSFVVVLAHSGPSTRWIPGLTAAAFVHIYFLIAELMPSRIIVTDMSAHKNSPVATGCVIMRRFVTGEWARAQAVALLKNETSTRISVCGEPQGFSGSQNGHDCHINITLSTRQIVNPVATYARVLSRRQEGHFFHSSCTCGTYVNLLRQICAAERRNRALRMRLRDS